MKKRISKSMLQLSGPLTSLVPTVSFIVGIVGLVLSFIFFRKDHHHFMYSYMVAFSFFMTLTLGNLFFVLIQHLTRAGWSVVVRRLPEVIMKNMFLMAIFFIPILFGIHDLYHWSHQDAVLADELLQGKAPYLNTPFFIVRGFLFFAVWIWLVNKFYNSSVLQDKTGDSSITLYLQKTATYGMLIFALSQTFALIDWIMSITPHWYSTIFGIYMFAGSIVVALAVMSLLFMILRANGFLKGIVTTEHFHDIGKLLYGFNVFWSYIAFSQYFLIWYANIPEETVWYAEHFNGSWNTVAIILAIGHFGVPFVLFMSRHAKRNLKFHAIMAVWLILMHALDLYWLVMPNINKLGIHLTFADIVPFLGIGGIYFGFVFLRLSTVSLIPHKDPRLDESLNFHNY